MSCFLITSHEDAKVLKISGSFLSKHFILYWCCAYLWWSCRLFPSCFSLNQLMLSSGYGKLGQRLSHISVLLPPLEYVLQLCKLCTSRFLLCSLSKLFHISLHTNRNTETQPVPFLQQQFFLHADLLFYVADQSEKHFFKSTASCM